MIGEIVLDDKKYAAVRLDCKFDLSELSVLLFILIYRLGSGRY